MMLYTGVLMLELSPLVFRFLHLDAPLRLINRLMAVLVYSGIILSLLYQNSLGALFLIMPTKLHPLWYSPLLPLFFLISAASAGLSTIILVGVLSEKVFCLGPPIHLLSGLARPLPWILGIYLALKIGEVVYSGEVGLLLDGTPLSLLFLVVELLGGALLPLVLYAIPRVRRDERGLFWAAFFAIGGVMLNRYDLVIVAQTARSGAIYFPSLLEFAMQTVSLAPAIIVFGIALRFLHVFPLPLVETVGEVHNNVLAHSSTHP